MHIGTVAEIWRYPCKSMRGERVATSELTALGLVGDRSWAIRDEQLGGIRGAKRFPALRQCTARFTSEPSAHDAGEIEVTLPDGTTGLASDPATAQLLSATLGHEVTLWPRQPAEDEAHYRRGAPVHGDRLLELRETYGLTDDEPLPDVRRISADVLGRINRFASLPGTYFDAYPVSVLTTASLEAVQALRPGSLVDVRRFRPNVVVQTSRGLHGTAEATWEGRTLLIGEVELSLTYRCPRCVMVTQAVDELPIDRALMRTIVAELGHDVGIYAEVVRHGLVREGDVVVLT